MARQHGETASKHTYFKSQSCTTNSAKGFANIQFVQEKAPTVPIPKVLKHYLDEIACRSYRLVSSIPGVDLNKTWKTLTFKQKSGIVIEVAEHIHTLAKLTSQKLQSADQKWIIENFPPVQPEIRVGFSKTKSRRIDFPPAFSIPTKAKSMRIFWARSRISFSFATTTWGLRISR